MKVVLLSDTHNKHSVIPVPDGDLVLHAGDACGYGSHKEFLDFLNWYKALPHLHKIYVAGNHDRCLENRESGFLINLMRDAGVHYLQDSSVEIEGIKIYGSPWQPRFCDWAFNLDRGEPLRKKWKMIPAGLDILVTHGPPRWILDTLPNGTAVGCDDLLERVKIVRPKFHVFGHIHGCYGSYQTEDTVFINASNLDEQYHYANQPLTIEL